MRKAVIWIASIAGLIVIAGIVVALVVMGPRNIWGMLRYDQRQEGKLAVGQSAPDVVLTALDGSRVHLSERMRGDKPVVLIFGSYT
jgi:cytochrome oxidase Cu insertion factor (SCO1/SenC/PrrC family)